MPKDVQTTFTDALHYAIIKEKTQGFRVCVDEKDNMSVAELTTRELGSIPKCPEDTKKIVDVLITPTLRAR